MAKVLVIEDSPGDVNKALSVLRRLGIDDPEVFTRVDLALVWLQDVLDGSRPTPDLIILDLSFPDASGFEVLRFLRTNKAFGRMRVIVWTGMGEVEKELCRLFHVDRCQVGWTGRIRKDGQSGSCLISKETAARLSRLFCGSCISFETLIFLD